MIANYSLSREMILKCFSNILVYAWGYLFLLGSITRYHAWPSCIASSLFPKLVELNHV